MMIAIFLAVMTFGFEAGGVQFELFDGQDGTVAVIALSQSTELTDVIVRVFYKSKVIIQGQEIELLLSKVTTMPLFYGASVMSDPVLVPLNSVDSVEVRLLRNVMQTRQKVNVEGR